MTDKMDKSLDDLIAEQRTKKPAGSKKSDHGKKVTPRSSRAGPSTAFRSRQAARPDSRRDGRQQDAAGAPPRDPAYFMHDDRAGFGGREQQGRVPGSWKQQQRQQWDSQQQWERPRGRGAAGPGTDPIITTADGWEEVAQDEPAWPARRRGGGGGAQRRGGVFDRLAYSRGGEQQQYGGGGGRFGRGRGRGMGRGRGAGPDDGEPRRRYVDEHDHRDDAPGGPAGRPGRFQPYRVAGGVSKRSSRGPAGTGGRKWGHDLFDPNQPEGPVGGEGEEGGFGVEDGMME